MPASACTLSRAPADCPPGGADATAQATAQLWKTAAAVRAGPAVPAEEQRARGGLDEAQLGQGAGRLAGSHSAAFGGGQDSGTRRTASRSSVDDAEMTVDHDPAGACGVR
ncbi:hypothetical protein AN218_04680 [Streptomyces nanshensis]|uniref:Uncharacterized protein n=1 Tax=Streptomyces nanshensis TaxID=518642 RepID=A0A1E7LB59_9ACTN|nr:hypothetical protein AN218_04680 [Streptomyces nanshensis]